MNFYCRWHVKKSDNSVHWDNNAPTWAKIEGAGWHWKSMFHRHLWGGEEMWLDAHVALIKPTIGLGPHAILCPTTTPPHSSYPVPPLPLCPPSFKILSTLLSSIPSEGYFSHDVIPFGISSRLHRKIWCLHVNQAFSKAFCTLFLLLHANMKSTDLSGVV